MSDVRWEGLEELKAMLRTLPADLATEAGPIVETAARGAYAEILGRYPVRSKPRKYKSLRDGLEMSTAGGRYGTAALVIDTAKHAMMYEIGAKNGARKTGKGYNRGVWAGHPFYIDTSIRWRHRMYDDLKAMLERFGFTVSG